MKHNVGSYDVAVRFVFGCLLMLAGIRLESWWGLLGAIPALTAMCAFCPLYALFRIDTTFTDG